MALVVNDRVQQTGTANTTVSFTLSGSVTGYQSFSVIGNGNTTFYGATDTTGNWEVGIGTYATGGTLTRTTILASSNSGSAVTFSGTVNVFVTYPSEKSVNLDGSGNVSALGTIASGTWQGSTVGVAYGGTGVTTSSGANSVVLRDVNQNISFNNYVAGFAATTAAAGTTTLTVASARNQILVGSTTQTFQLPNATTLSLGQSFIFVNNSSGVLTVKDNSGATIESVPSGGVTQMGATSISTSAGSWGSYSFIPAAVDWGTNALNLASTVISGGTWNGGTIAPGYGGTGLTTFAAANNALYSTSSSALAAGTLPIAAGGTAGTTAATAFNNLSPITTTGDLIIGTGTNTAGRLGIGTSGYVLQSNGTTASWASPPGSSTLNIQDFTATSGQTSFTLTYTVGLVEGVYRNGIKLGQADYTATSGTAIVLGTGAITGDLIEVVYFTAVAVTNVVNTFSAGTTGFTPSTASTGAVTLAGTLNVANGGTGATSLSGANIALTNVSNTFTLDQSISGLTVGKGNGAVATNTAIGAGAIGAVATGTSETGVGYLALGNVSSGNQNTAVGAASLQNTTTGYQNTGIGFQALKTNTTGASNSGFGNSTLYTNSTGSSNTAIGDSALFSNTTASNNTAVGYQAGYSNTTGVNNVFVGSSAGANTTGGYNTFVGTGTLAAGFYVTSGTKNTIIGGFGGNSGGLDIRTASNYIVLSDGDGNPRGIFDGSGNFLVGQTTRGHTGANSFNLDISSATSYVTHATGVASGGTFMSFGYNTSAIGSITQNGTTGVLYNTTSDYRLKNNPTVLTGASEFIMALQPKTWDWWDGSGKGVGFIAHEFMEVAKYSGNGEKDAVDAEGNPKYQTIQPSSSEVMANLVALVQELKTEVDSLKQQLGK